MIPWDYNLAYGAFMGGDASSSVNSPIDTPVSNGMSDIPMVSWIFENEEYTEQYHKLLGEFLESVDFEKLIDDTAELIDEYVEKDPTKFCTYDEFKTGVKAIKSFCTLREQSVSGQLDGTIPSTSEGQKADSSALISTDGLNISDMGSMGGGMGGFGSKTDKAQKTDNKSKTDKSGVKATSTANFTLTSAENKTGGRPQQGGNFGGNFDPDNMPESFDPPEDYDISNIPQGGSPFGGSDSSQVSESSDEKSKSPEKSKSGGGDRPDSGGFSPMSGSSQNANTTAYILLGVSAFVLLIGLGFAFKFKR